MELYSQLQLPVDPWSLKSADVHFNTGLFDQIKAILRKQDRKYNPYTLPLRDSHYDPEAWQKGMQIQDLDQVENSCSNVMDHFAYKKKMKDPLPEIGA